MLDNGTNRITWLLALTEQLSAEQANAIFSRIAASGSTEIIPYLRLGDFALRRKDMAQAEVWVRQAEKLQPKQPAVLLALGKLALARGEFDNGVRLLEEAKDRGESSANLYSALGVGYNRLKRWEKNLQVNFLKKITKA